METVVRAGIVYFFLLLILRLSGRETPVVGRRAAELGIEHVEQGCVNKGEGFSRLIERLAVQDAQVCYVGDDMLDIPPMRRCGFPVAVANAQPLVKRYAQYVTCRPGGRGALPEVLGDAGQLVEADRPDQIAAAIARLLRDNAFAATCRARGIARARNYDWKATASAVFSAYQQAIDHHAHRR